jgi:hypothetical protein
MVRGGMRRLISLRGDLLGVVVVLLAGVTVLLGAAPAAAQGPATKLAFVKEPPAKATAGQSFTVEVAVEDEAGEVLSTDNTDGVGLGLYAGPAQPQCASLGAIVLAGIATFSCSFEKAGTGYEFYAYSSIASEDAFSNSFEVLPGTAARLAFVTDDPRSAVSRAHQFPVHVSVLDSFGNVVSSDNSDEVALALASGPGGTLECTPPSSVTVVSGVAEFTCSIDAAGMGYMLKATSPTDAGLGSVQSRLAVNQAPSLAHSHVTISPNPAVLNVNGGASFTVSVLVRDEAGNPIEGDEVALDLTGVLPGTLQVYPPSPQKTNGAGEVDYTVSCNEGYCAAGTQVGVGVVDETAGLTLASESEGLVFASIFATSGSDTGYSGQSATIELQGAEPSKAVSLSFDGKPVTPVGDCATGLKGALSELENGGDCTFAVPSGAKAHESVPVEITAGAQTYKLAFEVLPAPSLKLTPATGPAGTVIKIEGEGFERDLGELGAEPLKISFTSAPDTGQATTSAECGTEGLGAIIDTGASTCRLTVPKGTTIGEAIVAAAGYPTANAYFNVKATCAAQPAQPGCTLTGISINSSNLVHFDEIYVGATTAVTIDADYSDGSAGPLPAGGSTPSVKWSTEPQPHNAITLGGVSDGNRIGLTANEVTSSPGVLEAEYEGFKATSDSLSAVKEPCSKCFFVNGALLNVDAEVPGVLSSTPIAGAVAHITQGLYANGGRTAPPPCIPENGGCASNYPTLPNSATELCTTESGGACQLIAEEGTIAVATEVEDTITLTPPTGYTVTGVKGCHSESGSPEAPVCHVLLKEFSQPSTITFELKPWPELTVKVGGPETLTGGIAPSYTWLNEEVDGATVTIKNQETGTKIECPAEGGEETFGVGGIVRAGKQAQCARALAPGSYEVSVGPQIRLVDHRYGSNAWVTSENPQKIKVNPGETPSISFNTAYEPVLTVNVGGPEQPAEGPSDVWFNELVDGAVATITPTGSTPGEPVECSVGGGEETDLSLLFFKEGKQASCSKSLQPGTYKVSVQSLITSNPGQSYESHIYVTSENPQTVTLAAGETPSRSFNTAYVPKLANSASGTATESSPTAEAVDGTVLSATASGGAGTVVVGQYESDPEGAPTFDTGGPYIDVFLSAGNTFTSLTFTDCDLEGGEYLHWYENGVWPVVSDETSPSGNPACITVTINEDTTPTLKQMTGTVFGVARPPASTSKLSPSLSPALMTPSATTAASGSVSLDGSTIAVQSSGAAAVKLTCTGTATCAGKLTLTAKSKGKGKKKAKTETIGTAGFSIPAGKTAAVKLALNGAGKALLKAAHGRLSATLTILTTSPSPSNTQTDGVHLAQQKATKAKKDKKQ